MRLTPSGDAGRSFGMSQAYARTKLQLDLLTREAASGQRADVAAATGGDTRPLAGIDSRLARLHAYGQSSNEAALDVATAGAALDGMQALLKGKGAALMSVTDLTLDSALASADSDLEAALGYLNAEGSGRYAFGGTRPTTPAVAGPGPLMAQIGTVVAGLTTADAITAAVANFFDTPAGTGGYLDLSLQGSEDPAGAVPVGPGASAANPITAADPALRDMLKGLTLAALAKRGIAGGAEGERSRLAQSAGQIVASAELGVIDAAARVGVVQQRVEVAQTRNAAELSALQIARNGITAADPYETATALAETQTRLDVLYALTAHLSRMTLADRL